ncbi:MAG: hypothetical protein ABI565_14670, partial [Vicinamibacteria bacterium]
MKLDARRAVLLALIVASLAYHGSRAYVSVSFLANPARYPQAPFTLKAYSAEVSAVSDESKAAGLKPGDVILRLGGRELRGYADLGLALVAAAPSGTLQVRLRRPEGEETLSLRLPAAAVPEMSDIVSTVVLEIALPLFFLGVGFAVAWLKPEDKAAWLLLYMMQTFSNLAGSTTIDLARLGPFFGTLSALWFSFFASSWSLAMVSFALVFPEPLPMDARRPGLKWLLLLPLFSVTVITTGLNLSIADFAWGGRFLDIARALGRPALILTFTAMSLFFWTLGFKAGTTKNLDAKRRLRILLIGAGVAMTPAALLAALALVTGTRYGALAPNSLRVVAGLMMLLFPMVLAYVVIVHKAMGVGMAIRQGLQYALAQRAIRFVQMAIGIVVLFGLLEIFSDPMKRQVDRVRWLGLAVLFMVFFQRGADRFRAGVDRRFFREAVDAERILADLGERV